jgi:hypothetical protein
MYGRAGYELLKRHVLINLKELFLENNGIFIAPAHTFLPKVRKTHLLDGYKRWVFDHYIQ